MPLSSDPWWSRSGAVLAARAHSTNALVADAQADSHAGVGALCFIIWDTLIHLDDEVEFVWGGANTWMKYMYGFIRYFPILAQSSLLTITTSDATGLHFSERGCRDWVIYQAAIVEAITLAVEIVLIVRIYALYNHNKIVLYTITVLYILEVAAMITSLVLTIPKMEFNAQCLITASPDIFMAYWISSLVFETILFALTLFQFFSTLRRGLGERTIVYVIMRDGTWAFALIFVTMLLNTLMYKLNDTPLAGISYFWALSVISFSGAHVLINLRRLSGHTQAPTSALHTGSVFSTIPQLDLASGPRRRNWRGTGHSTSGGSGSGGGGESGYGYGSAEYDSDLTAGIAGAPAGDVIVMEEIGVQT